MQKTLSGNQFAPLQDNPDNTLADNNNQMLLDDNDMDNADFLKPQQNQQEKKSLASFLPSMDVNDEPEQEDQIDNPFDIDDDKDAW